MEMIYDETALPDVAARLWPHIKNHKVLALHGGMGAGKTTLTAALCRYLQVADTVSSPTFSIINEYSFDNGSHYIYHIDLYRLQNEEEAMRAGVEDCIYSGEYCWIEWPERAPGLLPDDACHIHIALLAGGQRRLTIAGK